MWEYSWSIILIFDGFFCRSHQYSQAKMAPHRDACAERREQQFVWIKATVEPTHPHRLVREQMVFA
jgi:hypothetical protein